MSLPRATLNHGVVTQHDPGGDRRAKVRRKTPAKCFVLQQIPGVLHDSAAAAHYPSLSRCLSHTKPQMAPEEGPGLKIPPKRGSCAQSNQPLST